MFRGVSVPNISFTVNPAISPHAICDLREAVGWERLEEDYPAYGTGRYQGSIEGKLLYLKQQYIHILKLLFLLQRDTS